MDKSTPRPWHIESWSPSLEGWLIADDANGWTLCLRSEWPARAEMSAANAALIVKAVNAHEALVAALLPFANLGVGSGPGELCETYKIERDAIRKARAALAALMTPP